jgi:hypothetical protein
MVGVRWVAERRVLRRASHQSLKVAVFRDQSFDQLSQIAPAAPYIRGDWDADYRRGDREESRGNADSARTAPFTAVREMSPPASTRMEDVSWDEACRRDLPVNTLTFKPAARPWYGSQRAWILVLGAAVVVMMVSGALLVLRSSSDGTEGSTTVTPTATTSAVPPPAAPNTVGEEPLPSAEVPPPPPPPPEETSTAPAGNGGYTRSTPSPSATPTGRPRIPMPISVAPRPQPTSDPDHSAPGDAPRRHGGFW